MRDRREEILTRLQLVLDGVEGVRKAYRNLDDVAGVARPCARFFDGDEGQGDNASVGVGEHRGGGGHVVTMRPPIGIALSGPPETVGSDLNALRLKVIKAVTTDSVLLSICGRNGRIKYEGLTTALGAGQAVEGEIFLQIAIAYPLIPAEL